MIAVIRVRGSVGVNERVKRTLDMLRLFKSNHLVLVGNDKVNMVKKVKDYVTFGEISVDVLAKVLEKRGRIVGNKRISSDVLKELGVKDFQELAERIISGELKLNKDSVIKPVFRLKPPKKGFDRGGIKKPFRVGGVLGDRGVKINELILRMC